MSRITLCATGGLLAVWAYDVLDPLFGKTEFLIDFGPDENVITALERVYGGTGR